MWPSIAALTDNWIAPTVQQADTPLPQAATLGLYPVTHKLAITYYCYLLLLPSR